ncbi:MAG: divergent polysaccharide deacetylase family protein [Thermodesulfobacteriota bacterium]
MATKARSRQKKSKRRPYGRYLLGLLALSCLAGIGYFVFLQVPLFPPAAEPPPARETANAPRPALDEPLITPPPAGLLPSESAPPAPNAAAETVATAPAPPPTAAPLPAQPAEPAVAPKATPRPDVPLPAKKAAAEPPAGKPSPTASATRDTKPLVAIVIDDMGYQPAIGRRMLALPLNLSFSFLPAGPQTKELTAAAQRKKRDILLHLPLEATDRTVDPGPGTLTVAMEPDALRTKFAENLAAVPMAIGINNHMGSRFTEERPAMILLLREVKQRGLFFLDSRTSNRSVACAVAQENGVPCLPRHLFLDNEQNQAAVIKQIDALLTLAEKKGWAIGLGHPHPATLAALAARQQQITERAELVGIGTLFQNHGR